MVGRQRGSQRAQRLRSVLDNTLRLFDLMNIQAHAPQLYAELSAAMDAVTDPVYVHLLEEVVREAGASVRTGEHKAAFDEWVLLVGLAALTRLLPDKASPPKITNRVMAMLTRVLPPDAATHTGALLFGAAIPPAVKPFVIKYVALVLAPLYAPLELRTMHLDWSCAHEHPLNSAVHTVATHTCTDHAVWTHHTLLEASRAMQDAAVPAADADASAFFHSIRSVDRRTASADVYGAWLHIAAAIPVRLLVVAAMQKECDTRKAWLEVHKQEVQAFIEDGDRRLLSVLIQNGHVTRSKTARTSKCWAVQEEHEPAAKRPRVKIVIP